MTVEGARSHRRGTCAPISSAPRRFTAGISGNEQLWLPLSSAQIITEPLPQSLWDEIGWQGHELLGDAAHAYCYAQRTREGRITMGGRGVPYRYGSQTDVRGQTQQATIESLHAILTRLLPQTKELRIDHAWCGVLGVPRDWCTTAGLDLETGIGWAGGYVGLGVSSSNLSGRTLRDLILRRDTELTRRLGHRQVGKWEPSRCAGSASTRCISSTASPMSARKPASGTRRNLAAIADRITGH